MTMAETVLTNGSDTVPHQRKYPFDSMKIDSREILSKVENREKCSRCFKSRKFYCYSCFIPNQSLNGKLPQVKLPVKVDIIKHRQEIDGKSSAGHAAILAADDVKVYTYPDIPDYTLEEGVVLIFPSKTSVSVNSLFRGEEVQKYEVKENFGLPHGIHMGTLLTKQLKDIVLEGDMHKLDMEHVKTYTMENLPIKKAVFIDSTWNQCRGIYKDPKINSIKTVVLQNRISQFWRHQRGSPRWYLATVEAIHQFLLEVHTSAWGLNTNYRGLDNLEVNLNYLSPNKFIDHDASEDTDSLAVPYNGHYDNLLYFFTYMYDLIHTHYDHNKLLAYRRPLI